MPAAARCTRPTGRTTARCPIGVVIPRDNDDVLATVGACRAIGAPILSRGGGTSLAGQCCNVAVVFDFSKYMQRRARARPGGRRARVQPGTVLDELRGAAQAARPDVRARSVDAQPLHARRDDRQQLLRRALGDGRRAPPTTSTSSRSLTYDGAADARRPRRRADELEAIIRRGRPARRDLRAPEARCATLRDADPRALSRHPAPRVRLQPRRAACPRTASTSRGRWSAARAPA